jgi:hypothetical protein
MATPLRSVDTLGPATDRGRVSPPGAEAAAVRSVGLPNANFLLESVICDIHSLALHVGTLTMLVTACLRPGTTWNLSACRHLLHDEFKALRLALRYGEEIGIGGDATLKITNLCGDIAEAQKRMNPMLTFSAATRSQRDQLQSLSGMWRKLANELIVSLTMIEPTIRTRLKPIYIEDAAALRGFLKRATDGDTKAVDEAGSLRAPALKQRRSSPRLAVKIACTLETESLASPATVMDVSRYGLGIMASQPLALRQKVTVVLEDGRRLGARVVRAQGPRLGVELATPLAERDPLLLGDKS